MGDKVVPDSLTRSKGKLELEKTILFEWVQEALNKRFFTGAPNLTDLEESTDGKHFILYFGPNHAAEE